MVVEDEAPIRAGICDLLAYHGHQPKGVGDGERGLELLEQAGLLGMRPVNVALRPEKIHLHVDGERPADGAIQCSGRLVACQFLGINTRFEIEVAQGLVLDVIRQNAPHQSIPAADQRVTLSWREQDVRVLESS